jgi:hypothetical protein
MLPTWPCDKNHRHKTTNGCQSTHLHEVLHGDWLLHVIFTHLSDLSRRLAGNFAAHTVHGGITADVSDVVTTAEAAQGRIANSRSQLLSTQTASGHGTEVGETNQTLKTNEPLATP